jgi:hypothetical protein
MPRPSKKTEVPSIAGNVPDKAAVNGHTITIYADYAIWDETSGKYLTPEDLKRV